LVKKEPGEEKQKLPMGKRVPGTTPRLSQRGSDTIGVPGPPYQFSGKNVHSGKERERSKAAWERDEKLIINVIALRRGAREVQCTFTCLNEEEGKTPPDRECGFNKEAHTSTPPDGLLSQQQ